MEEQIQELYRLLHTKEITESEFITRYAELEE